MFGLSGLRLYGAIGGLLAFGALLVAAWTGVQARADLRELRADAKACSVAAEKQAAPSDRCAEPIKAAIAAARAAKTCDVALFAANSFAIQSACSMAVKAEVAGRMTAEAGQRAAEAEVDRLIADQAQIADRAEARGRAEAQRKDEADAAINSAPPAAGLGGKRCDAACLRRLTGKA